MHAPVFGMVQLYQCTIYHCTSVPVHHVPPQALAPILCNALMRSSLHGWRVHGHNVVTYHCHGGLDNCQPESTFMFHWVYSRPWLLLCFLQFGLLLVLCNASLCNGSNQCLHFSWFHHQRLQLQGDLWFILLQFSEHDPFWHQSWSTKGSNWRKNQRMRLYTIFRFKTFGKMFQI